MVERIENEALFTGKQNSSKATWDFQQFTNGFGTRAEKPNEIIGRDEADRRFDRDWAAAASS